MVPLTLIFAVSTALAVSISFGLLIFICCCMRARKTQKRQKRREKLEHALAITPLKADFFRKRDEDCLKTTPVPRQDPIEDNPFSDVQTDDQGVETPNDQPDNYGRSQSWAPAPSTKLIAVDPQRRQTLAVLSLTPSSSDSSLASCSSENDLEQLGRESEWTVYQGGNEKPVVHFSLYFSTQDSTLFVCLKSVSGLARKYYPGCSSFLKVSLLPKYRDGFRTDIVRKSLNPHFNESFQFCKVTLAEAQGSFLKIKLYVREKWNRKDRFSGEVFAECHQLLTKGDSLLELQRTFSIKRTKLPKKNLQRMRSKSTSEETSNRPYLGDLFVSLQYQPLADRLKVMIRKAENLLVDSALPGNGDVYVTVRLLKQSEMVGEYSTQRRSGTSPIWNQPFLFHPKSDEIQHHSILLAIFRGRRLATDVMVGKVEVGIGAGETGVAHWTEMLQPLGIEVAKWHRIKPPFS
ncbi:synaptotagmin-5 isoform X2 [Strongylocentrotus purpuratus]|uniref:C2 domain-containing protein n=1 Tax=Strongylocentrotus purpuratus TaxID=7668 RepID=A0A7M7SV01_STRPU|nr:synaptotagmin-5 isoform X2 [Strongylocentrotus purpuratus]